MSPIQRDLQHCGFDGRRHVRKTSEGARKKLRELVRCLRRQTLVRRALRALQAQAQRTHRPVQVQRTQVAQARKTHRYVLVLRTQLAPGQCIHDRCRYCVQRWRRRHVLIHGRRSNARHCGSWRMFSTTDAGAAYPTGAGGMYPTTGAGVASLAAMLSTTGAGAAYPTGAGKMCPTTGAGAASLEGARAMYSTTGVGVT